MSSARIAALLKDYGWGLNLVFIGLAAYFVAGAVNAIVARSIRVVPTVEDVAASQSLRSESGPRPKVPLTTIASRNLFNVKREELNPKAAEDNTLTDTVSFDGKDLKACTVPAVLSATLVSAEYPEWSLAVLVSNTTHEPEVYSIRARRKINGLTSATKRISVCRWQTRRRTKRPRSSSGSIAYGIR